MFHKFFQLLDPFRLIKVATLYIDGPEIQQQAPINQGEARRDFLEAEIDLAPDVLAAQQLFGPQFAESDFNILLDSILGTNTTDQNRTQQIGDLNNRIEDFEGRAASLQAIIDEPAIQHGGRNGQILRQQQDQRKEEARQDLSRINSDLGSLKGQLSDVQNSVPGDGTRSGGLAELLGGAEIADVARTEGLLDGLSQAESSANTLRREADIGDVQDFTTRFGSDEGVDSLRTDELNRALDRVEGLNQSLDTEIGSTLRGQALDGLEEGLTDREQRILQQSVRTASEARGRLNDPVSVLNEAEATVLADRNRLNENRAFAQNVDSTDLNKAVQDRGFSINTAQALQGAGFDPFAAILGRSSGAPGIAQAQIGNAFPFVQGTPSFDTTGGIDLALGNQANNASIAAANAGAQASTQGALIGTLGALGGGLLGGAGAAGGFSSLFG